MIEGGGSSSRLIVHLHGDLLKDEICFTGTVSPAVKGLLSVVEIGILSALIANSVLCLPIRVLQCVWDRCRFCRCKCDFKNLFVSDG